MSNVCKDLLWLLSGGVNDTIRHRNALKAQLAATESELRLARERVATMEQMLKSSISEYDLPFIMLVALPKSASTYLTRTLHRGLNIRWKETSCGSFPLDVLDHRKLLECSAGKTISRAHIDLNPTNSQLLRSFCPRMVLHLRDPRQALLSLVHYLLFKLDHGDSDFSTWVTPAPSADVLRGSLPGAIDWHLAHQLQNMLEWTERWLAHAESGESPAVLITHYHELHENAQTVVDRILKFYQIPAWAYTPKDVPKDDGIHFRKGELEEWREVFNPTQQKICAEMMAGFPRVNRLYGDKKARPRNPMELPATATRNGHHVHANNQSV